MSYKMVAAAVATAAAPAAAVGGGVSGTTTTDVGGGAPAPTAALSAVAARLSPCFHGGDSADHNDPPCHGLPDTRVPDGDDANHHEGDGDAHVARRFPTINDLASQIDDVMLHKNVAGSRATELQDDERSPRVPARGGRGRPQEGVSRGGVASRAGSVPNSGSGRGCSRSDGGRGRGEGGRGRGRVGSGRGRSRGQRGANDESGEGASVHEVTVTMEQRLFFVSK